MTDDWDFYFCRVENKAASIYVDLGVIDRAPVDSLPFMVYVHVAMNAPREDGLSSQDEFNTLTALEDRFQEALVDDGTAYVGRCTTNSCRDFFFYAAEADSWEKRVADCMQEFPSYQFKAGVRKEPDWSTYLSYLYPTDTNRQAIENRRVCEALERNGDKLSESREIDHWAYFPSRQARDAYVREAVAQGFMVRELSAPDEDQNQYSAQLWRSDIPSFHLIDQVTLPLFNLALKNGGQYDGWETFVVT